MSRRLSLCLSLLFLLSCSTPSTDPSLASSLLFLLHSTFVSGSIYSSRRTAHCSRYSIQTGAFVLQDGCGSLLMGLFLITVSLVGSHSLTRPIHFSDSLCLLFPRPCHGPVVVRVVVRVVVPHPLRVFCFPQGFSCRLCVVGRDGCFLFRASAYILVRPERRPGYDPSKI